MVSLHQILQKRRSIVSVCFVFLLFILGYIRHLLISNWMHLHNQNMVYQNENISWLRSLILSLNIPYSGSVKAIINLFFILSFGMLALAFFHCYKMKKQKLYFIGLHFGLTALAIVAYGAAQYFNLDILDEKSRDIIVFLQAPYTFVLIYFTHYLSVDTNPL